MSRHRLMILYYFAGVHIQESRLLAMVRSYFAGNGWRETIMTNMFISNLLLSVARIYLPQICNIKSQSPNRCTAKIINLSNALQSRLMLKQTYNNIMQGPWATTFSLCHISLRLFIGRSNHSGLRPFARFSDIIH